MPMIFIRHVGANLAYVEPLGPVDPGFGNVGGGVDPGFGHPIFGRPGHDLPGGGHIDNSLPGGAGHPDNRPPSQPPMLNPGEVLVLVRAADGKWHYASLAPGSPPPRPVPVPPPDHISGRPPGVPPVYPSGGPVPPQVTPQR